MKNCNKRGLTLVELLTVIVLLGIIIAISIPGVNTVLNNAKKNAFIVDVKNYAEAVRVASLKKQIRLPETESDITFVALNAIKMEKSDGKSSFGASWNNRQSYIVVKNTGSVDQPNYIYYFAGLDKNTNGMYLKSITNVTEKDVISNTLDADRITMIGVEPLMGSETGTNNIISPGFLVDFPLVTKAIVYTSSEDADEDYGLFTAKFNVNGGIQTFPVQKIKNGDRVEPPINPTRNGYIFDGWEPDIKTPLKMDTTFVAKWDPLVQIVTFDLNGGVGTAITQTVFTGTKANKPTDPTRENYTFDGWEPDIDTTYIIGPTLFKAKWKLNEYTVTYNDNGGSGGPVQRRLPYNTQFQIGYNESTKTNTPPTRSNYIFTGWKSNIVNDNTLYKVNDLLRVPNHNLVLTAQWMLDNYTVTFNLNGGVGTIPSQTVFSGSKAITPTPPTRSGYTFAGWSPAIDTPITANTTFTAQWTINKYTVTFNSNGGTGAPATQTKTHDQPNQKISATIPTRSGYRFVAWNTSSTGNGEVILPNENWTSNRNLVLYAQWALQQEYIFVLNGFGGGGTSDAYGFGTKTGFNLVSGANYYMESSGSATQTAINNGKQLAVFIYPPGWAWGASNTINHTAADTREYGGTYFTPSSGGEIYVTGYMYPSGGTRTGTVTWNSTTLYLDHPKGGSIWKNIDSGSQLTLPQPQASKTGHTFSGWSNNQDGKVYSPGASVTINAKTAFTAQWTANKYTVTFNSNGGTAVASQSVSYGSNATEPANPTRTGYTFAGWSPSIASTTITGNTTFTAQWTINKYTVSFNLNGGSGSAPNQTINYGSNATAPANPTRTGYTFAGWSPSINNSITANTTFTAQWTVNKYTVSFNLNGGSGSAPNQSVAYGSKATAPANPSRTYYNFNGWSPVITNTITGDTTFTAQWAAASFSRYDNHVSNKSGTMSGYTGSYNINFHYTAYFSGPTMTKLEINPNLQRVSGTYFYNNNSSGLAAAPRIVVTVNGQTYTYWFKYNLSTANPTVIANTAITVNGNVNSFQYRYYDGNMGYIPASGNAVVNVR